MSREKKKNTPVIKESKNKPLKLVLALGLLFLVIVVGYSYVTSNQIDTINDTSDIYTSAPAQFTNLSYQIPEGFQASEVESSTGTGIQLINDTGLQIDIAKGVFGSDQSPLTTDELIIDGEVRMMYGYKFELEPNSNRIEQVVVQIGENYVRIVSWYTDPRRSLDDQEIELFKQFASTIKAK